MKKIKCILLTIFITSMISISVGIYLYKQIFTNFAASKNMLEISLLHSLDSNDSKTVKSILAERILYDIYYVGKGDFNDKNFKAICVSWDDKISSLLLNNIGDNNELIKSKEFEKGIAKLNSLCK